jgi:hypothetical protein
MNDLKDEALDKELAYITKELTSDKNLTYELSATHTDFRTTVVPAFLVGLLAVTTNASAKRCMSSGRPLSASGLHALGCFRLVSFSCSRLLHVLSCFTASCTQLWVLGILMLCSIMAKLD